MPFLLVKKEFTSKRSQRSKYRSVRKNSYTQYLRRCSSTTKHHLQLHLTFRASTQYPRGPRNERWQPAGGSPGTGSGGAEEEGRREVAPADGRCPREKPQQPGAGEQRPPYLAACHLSLSPLSGMVIYAS